MRSPTGPVAFTVVAALILVWLADGIHAAAAVFTAMWVASAVFLSIVAVVAAVGWCAMAVGSWLHERFER